MAGCGRLRRSDSQSEPQPIKLPAHYALARFPADPNFVRSLSASCCLVSLRSPSAPAGRMSQVVTIATTGRPQLRRAVESVLAQTVPTACYVVCDGEQFRARV